jgi:AAA family ATP:ADP antiporter
MDLVPRHQLFTIVGVFYGSLFCVISVLLLHPEIGLQNTVPHRSRFLGWLSYVSIESFGSVMVQCYWASVNSSVDIKFAKNNFGYIVAGAQIGSILGPTLATHAETLGVSALYLIGAAIIVVTVALMRLYIRRFRDTGAPDMPTEAARDPQQKQAKSPGMMEGLTLLRDHNYVKGICAVSSLHLVQIAVFDYLMKVLAQARYREMYPNNPAHAMQAFASFMGHFGQATNSLSLLFSLLGTGTILKRFGLTVTLTLFPAMMLVCTQVVWARPTLSVSYY